MDLFTNIVILIALTSLSMLFNFVKRENSLLSKVINGVIIGIIILTVMNNPWLVLDEGTIFFDSRTIIYTVITNFYGVLTTSIAAIIGVSFRIIKGLDDGNIGAAFIGSYTIVISIIVTLIFKKIFKRINFINQNIKYYILGLLVHIFVSIPFIFGDEYQPRIAEILVAHLIIYPLIVLVVSIITKKNNDNYLLMRDNLYQKSLIEATVNATNTMEIYALDQNFNYIVFNRFHFEQMKKYYNVDIKKGDNFLSILTNKDMIDRIKNSVLKSLNGEYHITTSQVEINKEKYLEERYSPIIKKSGQIIGVTIFSQDITVRKEREQEVFDLVYFDPLTKIYNRRAFNETIDYYLKNKNHFFSIIYIDINGLKQVNDTLGHNYGDELLTVVANSLKTILDEYKGHVFRLGGDEFVVILDKNRKEQTEKIIEEAKFKISKLKIKGFPVSISYGYAIKDINKDLDSALKEAEDMMYKNKIFEIDSHRSESIKTILSTLRAKDLLTETHSQKVGVISEKIGKKLKMLSNEINALKTIATLHDIGKIGIDDSILNKPGKLTKKEFEKIKRHPEIGFRILSTIPDYFEIANDVLSHHERYDGLGYPRGLKGEEIPIKARIISVADAYDAMTSIRPYRKPLSKEEAIQEIKDNSGTQFDPLIVKLFLEVIEESIE